VNTAIGDLIGGWVIFMHRVNIERLKNGKKTDFPFIDLRNATKTKSCPRRPFLFEALPFKV
jgi:hypothetical protein